MATTRKAWGAALPTLLFLSMGALASEPSSLEKVENSQALEAAFESSIKDQQEEWSKASRYRDSRVTKGQRGLEPVELYFTNHYRTAPGLDKSFQLEGFGGSADSQKGLSSLDDWGTSDLDFELEEASDGLKELTEDERESFEDRDLASSKG